jgi:hypothetical protein
MIGCNGQSPAVMPFFIRSEDLGTSHPTQVQRLFAEYWLGVLESRVPMSIGPQPLSVLSLLESVSTALTEGHLRPSTLSTQVQTAITLVQSRSWLRSNYSGIATLLDALSSVRLNSSRHNTQGAIDAIGHLFDTLGSKRVSSHVDFIMAFGERQLSAASVELGDLITDLISLGHSESFLYGWGRALILAQTPDASLSSLEERLAKFRDLGKLRQFQVVFKIRKVGTLPHSDVLWFNKGAMRDFKCLAPLTLVQGEQAVLARICAPDYKAAIATAEDCFFRYRDSLAYSRKAERLGLIRAEFAVRCDDDNTELLIPADTLRDYEPGGLIHGNAIWRFRDRAPSVAASLEQVLYWLGVSRRSRGESEFISLWLALVSLFQSEDTNYITAVVARYKVAFLIQLHAQWIAEYLGKAHRLGWRGLTSGDVHRFGLFRPIEQRLVPIAKAAAANVGAFDRISATRPYLFQRVQALRALCVRPFRERVVSRIEAELRAVLPWARTVRHGVAHLGSASITGLDLINHHLRDHVTQIGSVGDAHHEFRRDFDSLVDQVLVEPCLSLLHVGQGLDHTAALPAKYWAR